MIQRLGAVLGFQNLVALSAQPLCERPPDQLLIVDDEDRGV
jgi:hypothetical protein